MPVTVEQFLKALSDSGLMTPEEVRALGGQSAGGEEYQDVQHLAHELVRRGRLTEFQAANLYHGKGKNLVLGNYVLLEKIGKGGMGVVYKARHRRMERVVALKVLPEQVTKNPTAVQRFHREVRAAARLLHANIVTAFDADEVQGTHFLVMEFVDGHDLATLLARQGVFSVEMALDCILQAARGLEYAHSQGVVHRDIKPANLLLSREGVLKILDMGLARFEQQVGGLDPTDAQSELTQTGQVLGTADYMAPEQSWDTHSADGRSDVYSLGCTLFRLLTGEPPYGGETLMQKLTAHREAPLPSLRDRRKDAPRQLDSVFQRMIAKDPADRYQSMGELVAVLEQLAEACQISLAAVAEMPDDNALTDFLRDMSLLADSRQPAPARPAAETVPPDVGATLERAPQKPESSPHNAALAELRAAQLRRLKWMVIGGATLSVVLAMVAYWVLTRPTPSPPLTQDPGENEFTIPEELKFRSPNAVTIKDPKLEREVAQWALACGGIVGLYRENDPSMSLTYVDMAAQLPEKAFWLYAVRFDKRPTASDASGLKLLKDLSDIRYLTFTNGPLRDQDLAQMGRVASLTHLVISQTEVTNAGLAHVAANFPGLNTLIIDSGDVTDDGLQHVVTLVHLRHLRLSCPKVTAAALEHLASLENLQDLDVSGTSISASHAAAVWTVMRGGEMEISLAGESRIVKHVLEIPTEDFEFISITLRNTGLTDEDLEHLKGVKSVVALDVSQNRGLTGSGLAFLEGTGLCHLFAGDTSVSNASLEHLRGFPLIRVNLVETAVTREGIKKLAPLPLRSVTLGGRYITDEALRELAGFCPKLTYLYVSNSPKVTDAGLQPLGALKQLAYLNLTGSGVTDAGLRHLQTLKLLKSLSLAHTQVTGVGLAALKELPLTSLHLGETRATDEGLQHVAEIKSLTNLLVGGEKIKVTDAGVKHLAKLENLKEMQLTYCNVTDTGARHLHALKNLRQLDVTGAKISEQGLADLRKAIPGITITRRD